MKLGTTIVAIAGTAILLATQIGCNGGGVPPFEDVCEKIGEMEGERFSEDECSELEGEMTEACGDLLNEAIVCVVGAPTYEDVVRCEEMCGDS